MAVIFKPEDHSYHSLDAAKDIKWLGVTSFVSFFKEKFDPIAASKKASANSKSKWYGIQPEKIREIWKNESDRAITTGTSYHDQREYDTISLGSMTRRGEEVPVISPVYVEGIKHAPNQKLSPGIYPEHFVYLMSAGLCGQSDRVEIISDKVDIYDYKTNKKIEKNSYVNWEGISKMMLGPCSHLEDCNFNHYALQLSTYMYMILKHNPKLKPGKLVLHHVIFEIEKEDAFGYPVIKKNEDGSSVVKEVIPYEVPYLKDEVIAMINWKKDNIK